MANGKRDGFLDIDDPALWEFLFDGLPEDSLAIEEISMPHKKRFLGSGNGSLRGTGRAKKKAKQLGRGPFTPGDAQQEWDRKREEEEEKNRTLNF